MSSPGLPWVDGIDAVELGGVRHGTAVTVTVSEPDCTCPVDTYWHAADFAPIAPAVTDEHISAMEDAVTFLLSSSRSSPGLVADQPWRVTGQFSTGPNHVRPPSWERTTPGQLW